MWCRDNKQIFSIYLSEEFCGIFDVIDHKTTSDRLLTMLLERIVLFCFEKKRVI